MKHDLQWFEERKGKDIIRTNHHTHTEQRITVDIDDMDAKRHHLYQECGYTFKDPLRVFSAPPESVCISCEG